MKRRFEGFSESSYKTSVRKYAGSEKLGNFRVHIQQRFYIMNKKSGFLFGVLFIILSQLAIAQFTPIKETRIDKESMEKATDLADKLLNGMKTGNIYLLSADEATEAMVKGLSDEIQQSVYARIKDEFGDFLTMQFVEALKPDNDKSLTVYRFRGSFENAADGPEIRVILNKDGKLSGFWILPWKPSIDTP